METFDLFNGFMSAPVRCNDGVERCYRFNNGDVNRQEFPLPACLEKAVSSRLNSKKYGYSPPRGNKGVLRRIAQFEKIKYRNNSISQSNVCLTNGVTNGLYLAFKQISQEYRNEDCELLLPMPSYPVIGQIAEDLGAKVKKIYTKQENSFLPTADEITEIISHSTKALIVTSPNNPTGTEYSEKSIDQIYGLCRDKGIYLIVDEIFSGLMLNERMHPAPKYDIEEDKVIRVNGWSKDRGVAGFRLGYIIAPSELMKHIENDLSIICGNASTVYNNFISKDMSLRRFLSEPESIPQELKPEFEEYKSVLEGNLRKYELNNKILHEMLEDEPLVLDVLDTDGGFCKFIRFDTEKGDTDFAIDLYRNSGALLVPGSGFGSRESGWMRLTFSLSPNYLRDGLEAIQGYLKKA
jgi:aspartate/methionine/tyrosine aminotransferase